MIPQIWGYCVFESAMFFQFAFFLNLVPAFHLVLILSEENSADVIYVPGLCNLGCKNCIKSCVIHFSSFVIEIYCCHSVYFGLRSGLRKLFRYWFALTTFFLVFLVPFPLSPVLCVFRLPSLCEVGTVLTRFLVFVSFPS